MNASSICLIALPLACWHSSYPDSPSLGASAMKRAAAACRVRHGATTYINGDRVVGRSRGVAGGEEQVRNGDACVGLIVQLNHGNLKAVVHGAPVLVDDPVLAENSLDRAPRRLHLSAQPFANPICQCRKQACHAMSCHARRLI